MNSRITLAVAGRVLRQVRRDHRTLAMLLVVPCVLISLLWWMFQDLDPELFDRFGPGLLAMFPFIVMFLVTSVTTLRERSSGTLERLLTMPLGKLDFLLGYALAFGLLAAVQSALAVAVSVGLLGLEVQGPIWLLGVVAVADAVLGTALGLLVSAFATTEFQAVQFMPAFVLPDQDGRLVSLESLLDLARTDYYALRDDPMRRVVSVTDPLGNVTRHDYENFGRRVVTTRPDPDGVGPESSPVFVQEFDAGGRLERVVDPLGFTGDLGDMARLAEQFLKDAVGVASGVGDEALRLLVGVAPGRLGGLEGLGAPAARAPFLFVKPGEGLVEGFRFQPAHRAPAEAAPAGEQDVPLVIWHNMNVVPSVNPTWKVCPAGGGVESVNVSSDSVAPGQNGSSTAS